MKVEPERTNWFGRSEVTRSPVQPELGAGNARATGCPLPAAAGLGKGGGGVRAPRQGVDPRELEHS